MTNRILRLAVWRTLCAMSRRHSILGVQTYVSGQDADDDKLLVSKVTEALALLDQYNPRSIDRLRRLARGIMIDTTYRDSLASWMPLEQFVRISDRYVREPSTHSRHVAATLVHEVTHAWLFDLGFDYRASRRPRIEAICMRAEAAFARRLPDGHELAAQYDADAVRTLSDPSYFSDTAFTHRSHEAFDAVLSDVGVPHAMRRMLKRFMGPRSA